MSCFKKSYPAHVVQPGRKQADVGDDLAFEQLGDLESTGIIFFCQCKLAIYPLENYPCKPQWIRLLQGDFSVLHHFSSFFEFIALSVDAGFNRKRPGAPSNDLLTPVYQRLIDGSETAFDVSQVRVYVS